MKGICTGMGRIKIRLNPGETQEQVELNFARKGIMVGETKVEPGKKPSMTGPPREHAKDVGDPKQHKQKFLQSTNNGIFGGSGSYQVR